MTETPTPTPSGMTSGAKAFLWLAGAVIATVFAFAVIGGSDGSDQSPAIGPREIVVEVNGTTTAADITLAIDGQISQGTNRKVPLTSNGRFGIRRNLTPGQSISISAQNDNDTGDITCTIRDGDRVLDTNASFGGYAVVTCSATV